MGPASIEKYLSDTQRAGWTTIILSLFHIGRPEVTGQRFGDIVFNGAPIVVSGGTYKCDPSWPVNVARLKQGGSVNQIYASFGGANPPVEDFQTLRRIYESNGNSFSGTALEQNFQTFRKTFPAIDGIDLDCEETYAQPSLLPSFIAFCEMLAGMGFGLTFCPYTDSSFWTDALAAVERSNPGAVKWWNLQCYSGGAGNTPDEWAQYISQALPGFPTDGFIVAGCAADGGPIQVQQQMSGYAGSASLGGGFIWNMDDIITSGYTMTDFASAVADGMQRPVPRK